MNCGWYYSYTPLSHFTSCKRRMMKRTTHRKISKENFARKNKGDRLMNIFSPISHFDQCVFLKGKKINECENNGESAVSQIHNKVYDFVYIRINHSQIIIS